MTFKHLSISHSYYITKLMIMPIVFSVSNGCSSRQVENSNQGKFLVTSPILKDTIYTSEYVADIHSLQNVEIRARVRGFVETIHVDEGKYVRSGQLLFSISSQVEHPSNQC